MDLAALFSLLLGVTGTILLADRRIYAPRRPPGAAPPLVVDYARSSFPVILGVLAVGSFIVEPFRIPSASMMPGLVDGDFIAVNKYAYGLRLPIVDTKIVPVGRPARGDVVVFRLPADPSQNYIKRLIGLPGDHVVVRDNHVFVNGAPLPLAAAGIFTDGYGFDGAQLARERLDGREHMVMFAPGRATTDFDAVVPAGRYFFLGDNRNDSEDSRFAGVGFVPERSLVGRASVIWMNWPRSASPRWSRIGTRIR